MAKLNQNINSSLLNTGLANLSKFVPVTEIKTNPILENIFSKDTTVIENIKKSMQKNGFNKEEPIVIGKLPSGEVIGIVDGHTRFLCAKELGLEELPCVYKTFDSIESASNYTRDRQFHRRNLSQSEIYRISTTISDDDIQKGSGRKSEQIAKKLGVSSSTVERAISIKKNTKNEKDLLKKLATGETTINKEYQSQREKNKKEKPINTDLQKYFKVIFDNLNLLEKSLLTVSKDDTESTEFAKSSFEKLQKRCSVYLETICTT